MSKTLQNYLTDVQRLLHDSTNRFWTETELTDYINSARKLVAAETACTREVIPLDIAAATSLVSSTYSLDTIHSTRRVTDILDVLLRYSTNTTYQLRFLPFMVMVRTALWQYQAIGTPTHYTINNRQLMILQWPAVSYLTSSVDCLLEPLDLVAVADIDADLAYPFTEVVQYYAAHLAKLKDQRFDEADRFFAYYQRRKMQAIGAQMSRRIVNQ